MNNNTQTPEKLDDRGKETIAVRGIAAAIQAMRSPGFSNLNDLLRVEGYELFKISSHDAQMGIRKG